MKRRGREKPKLWAGLGFLVCSVLFGQGSCPLLSWRWSTLFLHWLLHWLHWLHWLLQAETRAILTTQHRKQSGRSKGGETSRLHTRRTDRQAQKGGITASVRVDVHAQTRRIGYLSSMAASHCVSMIICSA